MRIESFFFIFGVRIESQDENVVHGDEQVWQVLCGHTTVAPM